MGLASSLVGIYNGLTTVQKPMCTFDELMYFLYIFVNKNVYFLLKWKIFLQNLQKNEEIFWLFDRKSVILHIVNLPLITTF